MLTREIATRLLKSELNKIRVSFLGKRTDLEAYQWNTGYPFPEKVIRNVEMLARLKRDLGSSTKIIVKNVRLPSYADNELKDFKDFWTTKGVNGVKISNVQNRGGNLGVKFRELCTTNCISYDTIFFIGWNGKSFPCCNDIHRTFPLGDLARTRLVDL